MVTPIKTHRYDLEFTEEVHWGLVKAAATVKMHQEDFAERILTVFVDVINEKNDEITKAFEAFLEAICKETEKENSTQEDTEVVF